MLAIVRPATMCAFIGSLSRPAKEGVGGMVFVGGWWSVLGLLVSAEHQKGLHSVSSAMVAASPPPI